MSHSLKKAMRANDTDTLVEYLRCRHDVHISPAVASAIFQRAKKPKGLGDGWSDDSWDMWLRNRIDEIRAWPSGPHCEQTDAQTAILHCFFLCLDETEEMLARIAIDMEPMEPMESEVARSKIGTTQRRIAPIDRTAMRVAPVEEGDWRGVQSGVDRDTPEPM